MEGEVSPSGGGAGHWGSIHDGKCVDDGFRCPLCRLQGHRRRWREGASLALWVGSRGSSPPPPLRTHVCGQSGRTMRAQQVTAATVVTPLPPCARDSGRSWAIPQDAAAR